MRGGKREGAGRKASEPTVRVSIPIGLLEVVQGLIVAYKADPSTFGFLNNNQIINDSDSTQSLSQELNTCQLIKDAITSPQSQLVDSEIEEPEIYHAELEQLYAESAHASAEIHRGADIDLLPNHNHEIKPRNNPSLDLEPDHQEIQAALRKLEKLSTADRKILKNSFGSLYEAAKLGVRAEGKNFSFPSNLESRLKIPRNSRISY